LNPGFESTRVEELLPVC